MNWYQNLYFGKNAEKRKERILQKLEEGRDPLAVYLVILPPEEKNQLEILASGLYRLQAERKGHSLILGIALGMREAGEVVRHITEDVYRATGTAEIRRYFTEQVANRTQTDI